MLEKKTAEAPRAAPKDKVDIAAKTKRPPAIGRATRTAVSKPAAPGRQGDDMHEHIQRRAYELWESEGRPQGRERDHWLQAEHEVAKVRRQRVGMSR